MVQSWFRTCAWSGSISSASMCSSPVMARGYWCSMTGPRSMSKDATRMYSTWFSVAPRGYCDLSRRAGCASGFWCRGAPVDMDECCDETAVPVDGVLDLELGSDVRSVSDMAAAGGCGDRDGRCDMWEGERAEGKDDSEFLCPPLLLLLAVVRFR